MPTSLPDTRPRPQTTTNERLQEAPDDDGQQRRIKRDALFARLTQPHDPDNALLRLWEAWARDARFLNDRFAFFDPEYTRQDNEHEKEGTMYMRRVAIRDYAYAVPSAEALDVIAQESGGRVVEVGAGTGYWAWLLSRRGVDVVAVDTGGEMFFQDSPAAREALPFIIGAKRYFPEMQARARVRSVGVGVCEGGYEGCGK